MIFIGDIAHPFPNPPAWGNLSWPWHGKHAMVANLEGSLVFGNELTNAKRRGLFNHISLVDALLSANIRVATLANNHVMDVSGALSKTCITLQERGIAFTGAGATLSEAASPAKIEEHDKTWVFLAVGWETIQCKPACPDRAGVYPLHPEKLLTAIKSWRKRFPDAVLVLLPHWNYELELYPQPAHRQLAMAAIDAGADAVIGHHPHRVGGIEIYRERPIAYSLGNWWMPQGVYFGGKLKFGDETLLQLALEWIPGKEIVCHWFEYSRDGHFLIYVGSENFDDSEKIHQLTPFAGMTHKAYQRWFAAHRVKRKALPIYYDYRHCLLNSIKDWYVHKRHSALMALESSGLRRILKV